MIPPGCSLPGSPPRPVPPPLARRVSCFRRPNSTEGICIPADAAVHSRRGNLNPHRIAPTSSRSGVYGLSDVIGTASDEHQHDQGRSQRAASNGSGRTKSNNALTRVAQFMRYPAASTARRRRSLSKGIWPGFSRPRRPATRRTEMGRSFQQAPSVLNETDGSRRRA
jgi:hypothetical protein